MSHDMLLFFVVLSNMPARLRRTGLKTCKPQDIVVKCLARHNKMCYNTHGFEGSHLLISIYHISGDNMKIIKRSGMEVEFDLSKITNAVRKANASVVDSEKISEEQIQEISRNVEIICSGMNRALNVEEIQDLVENQIMNQRAFRLASNYITYRYKRALVRKSNSTDQQILSLLDCNNEEVIQENSNKNPTVNSVQ